MDNELKNLLKRKSELDEAYYNCGESLISDEEYDVLKRRISLLEGEQPVGKASSSRAFEKFERTKSMLSLGNVFTPQEFAQWYDKVKSSMGDKGLIAEPKLDGLALELHYKEGMLVRAATRGNGLIGEDVTANAKTICSIPHRVRFDGDVVIRGEVVVLKADFEEFNKNAERNGTRKFVSPRSMAVGSLKNSDSEITRSRNLTFVAYNATCGNYAIGSKKILEAGDFTVVEDRWLNTEEGSLEAFIGMYNFFSEYRSSLPYEADGVVFKVIDYSSRDHLGETSSTPNWAIAWKFKAQRAVTTLREVEWRVGRTGKIVPRATFDSVFVAGANLTHASLHSIGVIKRLEKEAGFTLHSGCKIVVERSGDVIPYVSSLAEPRPNVEGEYWVFSPPTKCPRCGYTLAQLLSGEPRCENPDCDPSKTLTHFMRVVFEMKGIGGSIWPALKAANVEEYHDFFRVTREDIVGIPGLGESAWRIFHNDVERIRRDGIPFVHFLSALGVRGVGGTLSTEIAKKYISLKTLMESMPEEMARRVQGVGYGTAIRLFGALGAFYGLERIGVRVTDYAEKKVDPASSHSPLSGKKICFTGKLSVPRKEFIARIEALGAEFASVNRDLDYLVVGEKPGSKLAKAQKIGIEIVDEQWVLVKE